jgi:hypothetical protein
MPDTHSGDSGSTDFQSLLLLTSRADQAMTMDRTEEAESILQTALIDILSRAQSGVPVEIPVADLAARYAARLAGATTKGNWVNYAFELFTSARRPLPGPVIDELHIVIPRVNPLDPQPLRTYLDDLRRIAPEFGPTERFLMQRLEGLERLVAKK